MGIGGRWVNLHCIVFILAAGIITASCSKHSPPGEERDANTSETPREADGQSAEENESQPDKDDIEEDCAAFVRSTKIVPAQTAAAGCPGCPAEGAAVLAFHSAKIDRVSCSGDTCAVAVTIRAAFNAGSGERFAGGLTPWLSPEQKAAYLSGHAPLGEQTYRVQITYKRRDTGWRAVEFDRARGE